MSEGLGLHGPTAARADLAPGGVLRAAINFGNPVLAQRDPVTSAPRGVSVVLARELARLLGVTVVFRSFDAAGEAFAALKGGAVDLFLAGGSEAAAGVRQPLERVARESDGLRVVDGRFTAMNQAMAMLPGRPAGFHVLTQFIEGAKRSGLVAKGLAGSGQNSARVAPPAGDVTGLSSNPTESADSPACP